MVEFRTLYYGPMDRQYHQAVSEVQKDVKLEEPIFPISQLGETVPERDPTGRFKNIIQSTQAAIRGGAGTIQLVMMTPPGSATGGIKSHGKEVREAMKEVAMASKVNIASVELPTALNNLSGFDYQQMVFTEEKRKQHLDEVKDAIKFIADVGRGGGVDLLSWEFPRNINNADWQPKDVQDSQKPFYNSGEPGMVLLVDDRNGKTMPIRTKEKLHLPYSKKNNFEPIKITEEEVKLDEFEWKDFEDWAKHNKKLNEGRKKEDKLPETPEQIYVEKQIEGQKNSLLGLKANYLEHARSVQNRKKFIEQNKNNPEELKKIDENLTPQQVPKILERLDEQYREYTSTVFGEEQQIKELNERVVHLKPMGNYATTLSARGYAEAGVEAMRATKEGTEKGTVLKDVYVGPEIGWPGFYGSHPDEFINLIKNSRTEMIQLLTKPKRKDMFDKEIENPYYDPSISESDAEQLAKKHVKGLFDTGHMGMWLAYFKPNLGETETDRIARFNKWYTEQVEKIAQAGVVGGIQLVDSMSAAHGHLPGGQGIFPVKQTAEIFKNAGFKGFLVSEGHEEEQFGEGRIRTKTWQNMGATMGQGYFGGAPLRWQQVGGNYLGKSYSPLFMFGSYAPSNEFKLWSEVPFE